MIRHLHRRFPSITVNLVLAATLCSPAAARKPPADPPPAVGVPADVQKALDQIADLDLLIAITPVKLNAGQIDKIVGALDASSTAGLEANRADMDLIRTVAADVEQSRSDALKGAVPALDVTARIDKTLEAMGKRGSITHAASVQRVADVLKRELDPVQTKVIELQFAKWVGGKITVPGKMRDDPEKAKAYVASAAFTAYTERILLNQRALDLLHVLRKSAPAAPAAATAAPDVTAAASDAVVAKP